MRQLTTTEMLSLNKFLQMETNSLTIAKAGMNAIGDEQLRNLTQSGISAIEGRIKGLQQFIQENNLTAAENTVSTTTPTATNNVINTSDINRTDSVNSADSINANNIPKGVM